MKKLLLVFLIISLCVPILGQQRTIGDTLFPPQSVQNINLELYTQNLPDYYGRVVAVADGDTFYINWFSEQRKGVRVKGIDTPETVHRTRETEYWGPEASDFAKRILAPGTLVRLKFEGTIIDPFGRLLAYVWYWSGREWIYYNRQILEEGHAFVYIDYHFEYPNEFLEYQFSAMRARRGMWSQPERIVNEYVSSREEFARKKLWYRRDFYR